MFTVFIFKTYNFNWLYIMTLVAKVRGWFKTSGFNTRQTRLLVKYLRKILMVSVYKFAPDAWCFLGYNMLQKQKEKIEYAFKRFYKEFSIEYDYVFY